MSLLLQKYNNVFRYWIKYGRNMGMSVEGGGKNQKRGFLFLVREIKTWQVQLYAIFTSVLLTEHEMLSQSTVDSAWNEPKKNANITKNLLGNFNFYKYILFLVYFSGDGRTIKIFMSQNDSERSPSRETPSRLLPSPSAPAQLRNMNGYQSSHRGSKILVCKFI